MIILKPVPSLISGHPWSTSITLKLKSNIKSLWEILSKQLRLREWWLILVRLIQLMASIHQLSKLWNIIIDILLSIMKLLGMCWMSFRGFILLLGLGFQGLRIMHNHYGLEIKAWISRRIADWEAAWLRCWVLGSQGIPALIVILEDIHL